MSRQKKVPTVYKVVQVEWLDAEENGDIGWNDYSARWDQTKQAHLKRYPEVS